MPKIKFNFPDFLNGFRLYDVYAELKNLAPQAINADTEISSVYGNFPNNIWNGGTLYIGGMTYSAPYIGRIVEWYNSRGMALRLTLTNPLVSKEHFSDLYANMIVSEFHNGYNEIVVCNPELEKYLRDKYPNFRYIKSIIGTYMEDSPVFLDDKYYMSCLQRRLNNNWQYLEKIPQDKRYLVEFLCTDPCPELCPRLKSHYLRQSAGQLTFSPVVGLHCSFEQLRYPFESLNKKMVSVYINRETIVNEYLPRGFFNFKVSGRHNVPFIVSSFLEYIASKDYKDDVMQLIFSKYLDTNLEVVL